MDQYDAIIVGTGFASSFFLHEYLKHAPARARVLVLEKGGILDYDWKIKKRTNSDISFSTQFVNKTPQKPWVQNIAFGGGTCWTGNTPRLHPSDFKTFSKYGVGTDWPFDYDELEPYFYEVERVMEIAGESDPQHPRSKPFPGVPHKLNAFDRLLKSKYPDHYTAMPSARAAKNSSTRPPCCNNGVCSICPIGAKFQVDLHMRQMYADPRVTLRTRADVQRVDIAAGVARGVVYLFEGREVLARGDLVAVGAHAIATPAILLKSGLTDFALGRYLNEQLSVNVRVNLDGVENFDGIQMVTGLGLMFCDEPNRAEVPGCMVENWNMPWLRAEFGQWRHVAHLKFVMEDIPSEHNRVQVRPDGRPTTEYAAHSEYMKRGFAAVHARVERLLAGLPVEGFIVNADDSSLGGEAHIQGTTRLGVDPATSVVDPNLVHHRVRNLLALGSGVFPTCPAANPTLPLAALAVRAAHRLFASTT
jgi:choline dehydrogenase-like flavoprotein